MNFERKTSENCSDNIDMDVLVSDISNNFKATISNSVNQSTTQETFKVIIRKSSDAVKKKIRL